MSKQARKAHPESPWRWRRDWAEGRVRSSQGAAAALAWMFALTFGGVSVPLVVHGRELGNGDPKAWLVAALFPLAALGLLYWAVTATARWLRFRHVYLELRSNPGVVGGCFRGAVHLGSRPDPEAGYRVELRCVRRERRGKHTHEEVLWQEERTLPRHAGELGPHGVVLPVEFAVPFEAEPTSPEPSGRSVVAWQLSVHAALAGADLAAVFDVPVFRTADSSPQVTEALTCAAPPPDAGVLTALADDPSVQIRPLAGGGTELHFPAARNRVAALALSGFTALWLGFLAATWQHASGGFAFFLLPFAGIGLLLTLLSLAAWFQSTSVRARRDRLEVERRWLGVGSTTVVTPDEVERVTAEPRGSNGRRPVYAVRVHRRGRKPTTAAPDLRSKRDAQRVAAALWRALQPSGN